MDASAKPASKAAARRVWLPAEKQNKLKEETASASASASAAAHAKDAEKKATDTVSEESRKLWADEPVDPRYIGKDIDLATVTPEQLPELRRRVAVAKEEHAQAMAKKREEQAVQQQAMETAIEELRLHKLRLREEAARLQQGRATEGSVKRARRSDAEAARRVAAGRPLTARGSQDRYRSPGHARGRIKTATLVPPLVGRWIPGAMMTLPWIGPRVPLRARLRAERAAGSRLLTPMGG